MIHRYRKSIHAETIAPVQVRTVRLLYGDEELQAAVERARAFERRVSDEYQRRVGTYDRLLNDAPGRPGNILTLESLKEVPALESERWDRSDS
jgi:hypothetical protein